MYRHVGVPGYGRWHFVDPIKFGRRSKRSRHKLQISHATAKRKVEKCGFPQSNPILHTHMYPKKFHISIGNYVWCGIMPGFICLAINFEQQHKESFKLISVFMPLLAGMGERTRGCSCDAPSDPDFNSSYYNGDRWHYDSTPLGCIFNAPGRGRGRDGPPVVLRKFGDNDQVDTVPFGYIS